MTSEELAVTHFYDGYNCTQSILAVFCQKYGLMPGVAYRLACGLGTGMHAGLVCGALLGAVLVIGLKDGPETIGDAGARRFCHTKATEFLNMFREKHAALSCKGISDEDVFNQEKVRRAPNGQIYLLTCADTVRETVTMLEQMGY